MKRLLCLLAMVGLVGFVTKFGCDNRKTMTVEFSRPQATDTAKGRKLGDGDGIRIKFITAKKGSHDRVQEEVQRQMEAFINSDQYEIVRVSTMFCDYYFGGENHLLRAEVHYRLKK